MSSISRMKTRFRQGPGVQWITDPNLFVCSDIRIVYLFVRGLLGAFLLQSELQVTAMGTESASAQCLSEKKVDTVDLQSSAGQGQEQKPVQVIHEPHPQPRASNTSGSVLTNAAASVASTLQSAKEAISGK